MSSIIKHLSKSVVRKIAAAEVIQRPAYVVKELLENSIDAKSKKIKLFIEDGGKQKIEVIDDGVGMNTEDAKLSIERHATSKICESEDLLKLTTFGFRGEGLFAISSISHFEILTSTREDLEGTRIYAEGSQITNQESIAPKQGTNIKVRNLFYNTPARLRFLKSSLVEQKHILEQFQQIALSHPNIAFEYWNQGKQLYNLHPTKLNKRIIHLFGETQQKHLIPCQEEVNGIKLTGYIGDPRKSKRTRGGQFIFINKRYVKSDLIQKAVKKALKNHLIPSTFPFYILSLDIDPHTIDINVHPLKMEVKFQQESIIYTIVSAAIRKALAVNNIVPPIDFESNSNNYIFEQPTDDPNQSFVRENSSNCFNSNNINLGENISEESNSNELPWLGVEEIEDKTKSLDYLKKDLNTNLLDNNEITNSSQQALIPLRKSNFDYREFLDRILSREERAEPFNFNNSYILLSISEGVLVIDRKRAQEYILYQRYYKQLISGRKTVQRLLFPIITKLDPSDFLLIKECQPYLEKLGFSIELNPPNTVLFTTHPPEVGGKDFQQLLEEFIEQYKECGTLEADEQREAWASTLARRISSYSYRSPLNQEDMHTIIDQLLERFEVNRRRTPLSICFIVSRESFQDFLMTSSQK